MWSAEWGVRHDNCLAPSPTTGCANKTPATRLQFSMKQIQVGDFSMAVCERGQQGPPLLLVHGFPLTHAMWQPQIDFFAQRCRVIAPDLRGFGQTGIVAGPSSMEQMADDLASLLDAMQIREPVIFCGLSMGGYIGWEFWRKHRGRLAALIQCDTRAVADTPEVAKGRRILAAKVLAEGSTVADEAMLPKLFSPEAKDKTPQLIDSVRKMITSNPPASIAAALEGLATRRDSRPLLPQIDVPTLVIVGQYDAISPVEEMRQIAEAIPSAEFAEIPNAGHLATLENPTAVNEAISKFIESRL
jgi:pimeloyl-ACP methyl ester carboxylesterase